MTATQGPTDTTPPTTPGTSPLSTPPPPALFDFPTHHLVVYLGPERQQPASTPSAMSEVTPYAATITHSALKKATGRATFADSLEALARHQDEESDRRGAPDIGTHFDIEVQDCLARDRYDEAYRYLERVRAVLDTVMLRIRTKAIDQGVKPRWECDPTNKIVKNNGPKFQPTPSAQRRRLGAVGSLRSGHSLDPNEDGVMTAGSGDGRGTKRDATTPPKMGDPLEHPSVKARLNLLEGQIKSLHIDLGAQRRLRDAEMKAGKETLRETNRAQVQVHVSKTELERAKQEQEQLRDEITILTSQRSSLLEKVSTLEKQLKTSNRAGSSLRSQILVVEEQAKSVGQEERYLATTILALQDDLETLRAELAVKENTIRGFKGHKQLEVDRLKAEVKARDDALSRAGLSLVESKAGSSESRALEKKASASVELPSKYLTHRGRPDTAAEERARRMRKAAVAYGVTSQYARTHLKAKKKGMGQEAKEGSGTSAAGVSTAEEGAGSVSG